MARGMLLIKRPFSYTGRPSVHVSLRISEHQARHASM